MQKVTKSVLQWVAGAVLAVSATSASATLVIDGTFFGSDFDVPGPITELEGSFQAVFDDSVLTGSGIENFFSLPILTAFDMTPNPLGATVFDTGNVGIDLGFVDGVLNVVRVGGLPNVGVLNSSSDDFVVAYNATGSAVTVAYSVATETNVVHFAETVEGSVMMSRPSSVPEPTTLLLLALGLAGLGFAKRR